jgi:hypothetical protein
MGVALERWLKFGCRLKERKNKSGYKSFLVASPSRQEISWFILILIRFSAPPAPLFILCPPPLLSFRAAVLRVESALRLLATEDSGFVCLGTPMPDAHITHPWNQSLAMQGFQALRG